MPTRNVDLTDELDLFVTTKIESGGYQNASDVIRAALRSLERDDQEYETKLATLRASIDDGDLSGIAEGGEPFERVRQAVGLLKKR